MTDFIASTSQVINVSPEKVWEALTNPDIIKQYLFGTNVESDWQEGSPIRYRGEWQGKAYEDKGTILKMVPNELFESTYFSGNSDLPDIPENYNTVTYSLESVDGDTKVTITQTNAKNEEAKAHAEQNWTMTLQNMKKVLEES